MAVLDFDDCSDLEVFQAVVDYFHRRRLPFQLLCAVENDVGVCVSHAAELYGVRQPERQKIDRLFSKAAGLMEAVI